MTPVFDTKSKRWPKTVDEAVDLLIVNMSEEEREELRSTSKEGLLMFHHELGMCIRNSFWLWEGNTELLESCGSPAMHPDSASAVITEAVGKRLAEGSSAA